MKLFRFLLPCLLLVGCTAEAAGEESIVISIRNSRFYPARLSVPAGDPVRFVIRNHDPIDHEFIVGDEAVQQRHEKGTEAHHGAKPGEVFVPAGETRTTTYTFTGPGVIFFGCHLPGHYDYGMKGAISVTSS